MNYEIVQLEEKVAAGLKITTSNKDPNMSSSIFAMWQRFFEGGVYQAIPNKKNDRSICLYTNYESDANGAYDAMVCCEVSSIAKYPESIALMAISAGKYAKFIVQGPMQQAMAEFWKKLWSMDLDRKYICDFEEYQSGWQSDYADIHIYISIN